MSQVKDEAASDTVEHAPEQEQVKLLDLVPKYDYGWWRVSHLLWLNLKMTVPMMTGYLIGFDSSMLNGIQAVPHWVEGESIPTGSGVLKPQMVANTGFQTSTIPPDLTSACWLLCKPLVPLSASPSPRFLPTVLGEDILSQSDPQFAFWERAFKAVPLMLLLLSLDAFLLGLEVVWLAMPRAL